MRPNNNNRTKINHLIKVPQVRVILHDGTNLGVVPTYEALKLAKEQNLDLVEIDGRANPPITKIIDYGKFCYHEKKKQQLAKKNQKLVELKEIWFGPVTEINDLNYRKESAKKFLQEGHKVRLVVEFRGRQLSHPEIGKEKLEWMLNELVDFISDKTPINMEGKYMGTTLTPKKTK